MTTFTTPDGVVTDADPGGLLWITANTEAEPLPDELVGSCALDEEQTARTILALYEWEAEELEDAAPTYGTRADAVRAVSDVSGAHDEFWAAYALVPAEVADGDIRPQGDALADLMLALALVAGRQPEGRTNVMGYAGGALVLWADPARFSAVELAQLDVWGWHPDDDEPAFLSYRHGGAP